MGPGIKGNYFKVAEALSKSNRETWKNDLYDRVFTSDIDNERVKHLVSEIKALCRELHTGGRVEITFDTRYLHGTMEWEGKSYRGKIATFTGRVSWVSFDNRVTLYAASKETPRGWQNGWRKNPSIEIKKEILEDLLRMIEFSHVRAFGKGFKTRFMNKYSDRMFCQPAPESPPLFWGWDNDSDDGQERELERLAQLCRDQHKRGTAGPPDGGHRPAGDQRPHSWAHGSGINNGAGQTYKVT